MRLRILVVPAVLLAVALPAQARATGLSGIVVATQPQRGTLLLAGAHGLGVTVRGGLARAAVGERIAIQGARLHDGTVRLSRLRVITHVHAATLRGTVLRQLAHGTLLASGRSVVLIHRPGRRLASADDRGRLRVGDVGEFRVRFDDDALVEAAPPAQLGRAGTARIEGAIVSLSPFVVSTEGLPLTITVPAGMTLPTAVAAGERIELTVQVGAGNSLTLVAIDEVENEGLSPGVQAQEVEAKGFVISSTATQLVVDAGGTMFTFLPPTGATLPVLPSGAFVEVRGLQQNGTITLARLRIDDNEGGDGGGSSGGGDDGGGGH
jgi:hypothetical protein